MSKQIGIAGMPGIEWFVNLICYKCTINIKKLLSFMQNLLQSLWFIGEFDEQVLFPLISLPVEG